MLKRKQNKSLSHERFNSLFSASKTYRPLFKDVETFDDLYSRNKDIEINNEVVNNTKKIVKSLLN